MVKGKKDDAKNEEQLEDLEESTTNPEKQVVDTEEVNINIQNTGNENSKK